MKNLLLNIFLLNKNNDYRKKHHVSELKLDEDLIKSAIKYAEVLASNSDPRYLEHSHIKNDKGEPIGENLYTCTASGSACYDEESTEPADLWYDEVKMYDFKKMDYQEGTGHFTQMVWKGSEKMGCGVAKRNDGRTYKVVCHYFPAGNFLGEFEKNVFKSQSFFIKKKIWKMIIVYGIIFLI